MKSTRSFKRRRVELKRGRKRKEKASSVREGSTYQPHVDLSAATQDISEIPAPLKFTRSETVIIFDLETTGLGHKADIVQMSAICGSEIYDKYIMPTQSISYQASRVTGLTVKNSILYHKGQPVNWVTLQEACQGLLEFVQSKSKPLLVGHNIENFDVPVLYNALCKVNLADKFSKAVVGCIDTLRVAKQGFPKTEVENYKQETLVKKYLGTSYEAHNAIADVTALQNLFQQKLSQIVLQNPYQFVFVFCAPAVKKKLKYLVEKKVISANLCKKLGRGGICIEHLKMAHKRENDGIACLLKEPVGHLPRFTKSKAVIGKIVDFVGSITSS